MFSALKHFAPKLVGQGLHAIADPQDRQPAFNQVILDVWCAFSVDGLRSTGKDDTLGVAVERLFFIRMPGEQIAVDVHIANAATDQLRVLGAKIQDDDSVTHYASLRREFVSENDLAVIHRTDRDQGMHRHAQVSQLIATAFKGFFDQSADADHF